MTVTSPPGLLALAFIVWIKLSKSEQTANLFLSICTDWELTASHLGLKCMNVDFAILSRMSQPSN